MLGWENPEPWVWVRVEAVLVNPPALLCLLSNLCPGERQGQLSCAHATRDRSTVLSKGGRGRTPLLSAAASKKQGHLSSLMSSRLSLPPVAGGGHLSHARGGTTLSALVSTLGFND